MSTFKVTGQVTFISDVEQFGAGKSSMRIIVKTEGNYPNFFPITFYGDKIQVVADWNVGDVVEVETFPGGRLKKDDPTQAFTYLNGFTGTVLSSAQPAASSKATSNPVTQVFKDAKPSATQARAFPDDVPF